MIANNISCENGIISASFNKFASLSDADEAVLSKAERDRQKAMVRGHGLISHPIYRSHNENFRGVPVDRLKFMFPLAGVPILVYSMLNAMHSRLRKVAVVGSPDEKSVFDSFIEHFNPSSDHGTEFVFAHEPKDMTQLSRAATVRAGYLALDQPNGPIVSITGDIPLMHSIDDVILDNDIGSHIAVFDLNAKQRLEGMMPWDRNFYHTAVGYNGHDVDFKESNIEVVDFSRTDFFPYDVFYGSRKGGGFGFMATFRMAATALGRQYTGRSLQMMWTVLSSPSLIETAVNLRKHKKFMVAYDVLSRLSDCVFGGSTKVKFEHEQPARLYDVDSFEDWQCYELLLAYSIQQKDDPVPGLGMVYPHASEISEFREEAMPSLREKVPFFSVFRDFMRAKFQQYGLEEPCFYDDPLKPADYCPIGSLEKAFMAFSPSN